MKNERGSAMIISLMALLLLSTIGLALVTQAKTESQITGNAIRHSQALFSAEAGISEAVARMGDVNDANNYIGQPLNTADPEWGVYVVTANGNSLNDPNYPAVDSDGLDNDLDGFIDENNEAVPEVLTKQTGSDQIAYPWVKVEYVTNSTNQVVRYGDHDGDVTTSQTMNLTTGAPVIRIRSEGNRGNAMRRLEVEAVKATPDIPPTAMYTESDNFKFNGTQFKISGQDYDPNTGNPVPGNPEVQGMLTTQDPADIIDDLSGNQTNNVEGAGAEPSIGPSPVDLDLQQMYDTYSPQATITSPGGTISNTTWGDYNNYEIVNVTGDIHVSGLLIGGGILLVDGDFDCTGQFTWYGLVIVLGDIKFSGGGSGTHIWGSVLAQGSVQRQDVGGNADIFYSSEALNRLANLGRYQIISWNES